MPIMYSCNFGCSYYFIIYCHFLFVTQKTGTLEIILKEDGGQVYTTIRGISVLKKMN